MSNLLGKVGSAFRDLSRDVKQDVGAVEKKARNAVARLEGGVDVSMGPLGKAPALKRPLVMITGLTMQASSFDPMARHLAGNPANGKVAVYVVQDGKFHAGGVGGKVMDAAAVRQSKLFEVQYPDVKAAPSVKAPQIAQAMRAITAATGQHDVDVVCHSAGCTDFRLYLDGRKGSDRLIGISRAIFIGPASHGTEMGNLGNAIGAPLGLKKAGAELAVGSPLINGLNSRWNRQSEQVKGGVTIIGLQGAPTATPNGIQDGDGYMAAASVGMPGAKQILLRGIDPTPLMHLWEVHYSGVINAIDQTLGATS
jgi:hypothetical protein